MERVAVIESLEGALLAAYTLLKSECKGGKEYRAGWNELALKGISGTALDKLAAKGLITVSADRHMQVIQVIE